MFRSVLLLAAIALSPSVALADQVVTGDVSAHVVGDKGLTIDAKGAHAAGTVKADGSGRITCQLDELATGIGLRDHHMKEKYLETGKYPAAELALDPAAIPGSGEFDTTGKLTLHGVTRAVKVHVARVDQTFRATFGLELPDYGVQIPSYLGITVAKHVDVTVAGLAK